MHPKIVIFHYFVSFHFWWFQSCEDGVTVDQFQPVEELLALIASFTLLGKAELKVTLCVTNPQPPGFKFEPPLTRGTSSPPMHCGLHVNHPNCTPWLPAAPTWTPLRRAASISLTGSWGDYVWNDEEEAPSLTLLGCPASIHRWPAATRHLS